MKRTKTDESGHFEAPALSAPQAAALEIVALGKNDGEVAEAVGVTRQTVNGWRNHDPAFIAAVNVRRRELWEETHNRLRGMATRACDVVTGALDGPEETALTAALHVLKALKIYGNVKAPSGPATVEAVLIAEAEMEVDREISELAPMNDALTNLLIHQDERPSRIRAALLRVKARHELTRRKPQEDAG